MIIDIKVPMTDLAQRPLKDKKFFFAHHSQLKCIFSKITHIVLRVRKSANTTKKSQSFSDLLDSVEGKFSSISCFRKTKIISKASVLGKV